MNIALAAAVAALALAGSAAAQDLKLVGPGGTLTLTPAEFAALPHESLTLTQEGKTLKYQGVPLTVLLQKAGAPSGKALKGPELADTVIVTAADGYRVVLALAETDALMRPEHIMVADKDGDGAALPPGQGPYRLVVEGDLRAARSARQITSIEVRRIAP